MNCTGSPLKEKQTDNPTLKIPKYHKREHSITHTHLVFITKYSYSTMKSYDCSFILKTVTK